MLRMELRKPAGRLQHRPRLADPALPTCFAQRGAAVHVFEKHSRRTRRGMRVRSQTSRPEFEQWPEHALIDLRFVSQVAPVTPGGMIAVRAILDEHPPLAATGPLAGDHFVRKGAH